VPCLPSVRHSSHPHLFVNTQLHQVSHICLLRLFFIIIITQFSNARKTTKHRSSGFRHQDNPPKTKTLTVHLDYLFFRYSSHFETFERYFISFPTHYLDTEVHNIPFPPPFLRLHTIPLIYFFLLSNSGDLIDSFSFFSILLVVLDSFCALLLYFFLLISNCDKLKVQSI